jgi:hypothetical protein
MVPLLLKQNHYQLFYNQCFRYNQDLLDPRLVFETKFYALTLDQLFSARPVLGHADHRMPVPGLYLCGSGAHPGGGVTGAPGHNAAQAVLKDLGR